MIVTMKTIKVNDNNGYNHNDNINNIIIIIIKIIRDNYKKRQNGFKISGIISILSIKYKDEQTRITFNKRMLKQFLQLRLISMLNVVVPVASCSNI